jgi:prevent-host-death family protein
MPLTVELGGAKARLAELVARVEAGEEVIIARGRQPVARLAPSELTRRAPVEQAIEDIGLAHPRKAGHGRGARLEAGRVVRSDPEATGSRPQRSLKGAKR